MAGIAVAIATVGELTASAKLKVGFPNKKDMTKPAWSQETLAECLLGHAQRFA